MRLVSFWLFTCCLFGVLLVLLVLYWFDRGIRRCGDVFFLFCTGLTCFAWDLKVFCVRRIQAVLMVVLVDSQLGVLEAVFASCGSPGPCFVGKR